MSKQYAIAFVVTVLLSIALFNTTHSSQKDESFRVKFNEWKNEYGMSFDAV